MLPPLSCQGALYICYQRFYKIQWGHVTPVTPCWIRLRLQVNSREIKGEWSDFLMRNDQRRSVNLSRSKESKIKGRRKNSERARHDASATHFQGFEFAFPAINRRQESQLSIHSPFSTLPRAQRAFSLPFRGQSQNQLFKFNSGQVRAIVSSFWQRFKFFRRISTIFSTPLRDPELQGSSHFELGDS